MDNPFTKKIHLDILEHLAKGETPIALVKITGETYSNIKFHLSEMRDIALVKTNIELGVKAGTYKWVIYI
jgi:hypothetical protein